ncbi:MAG: elongator complex protein 3 [Lutispora sp.]|jgi:radical SAM enzyme (TIGR01210 family)|uniref:elongator complex protein 3 n=1 Tax=Lutispora sp. TaxID=2828727 RepID=UPI003565871E
MSKRHYIIPIFIPHLGCPHDCIFCNQKKITGQLENITVEDAEEIIERYLETIDSNNRTVEIAFFGGSFTGIPWEDQNKFLALANKYLVKGKIDTIRLSTRPDYINKDIINNLKKYGANIVELGIQSMNREVLDIAKRGHSPEDVMNAISLLKNEGFIVGAQLMVGLPKDDEEKAMETVKQIVDLKPNIARIYPVLVIKDTYLEEMYRKGLYKPLTLDEAVSISKKMLIYLEKSGIKVIRIGLQPTDDLSMGDNVVAGPYHPSMRQLVEAEIYKDMILYMLETIKTSGINAIEILSNPKDFSAVLGQRRSNYEFLKNLYRDKTITFKEDTSIDMGTVAVTCGEKTIKLSKNTFYHKISF